MGPKRSYQLTLGERKLDRKVRNTMKNKIEGQRESKENQIHLGREVQGAR